MSKRRRRPTPPTVWEPLRRASGANIDVAALTARYGITEPDEIWGSRLYTCTVRYSRVDGVVKHLGRDDVLWLSIHRTDRKPIRDWRHMQAIKNDVAGPDRLAVEVYPPESELVDTSNEYHLWVLPVGFELPFGFDKGGLVMTPEEIREANERDSDIGGHAVQRPWQPGLTTGPGRGQTGKLERKL